MKKQITNQNYAVGYCRYSSDKQDPSSIDAQKRAILEKAQRDSKFIKEWYIDEAVTGTSTIDRKEFLRMIDDAAKRGFDTVYVHKYDRFMRNLEEAVFYEHKLNKNGITLVSVVEQLDDNLAVIVKPMLYGMAEFYSRNLRNEIQKGLKERVMSGRSIGGNIPYGYKLEQMLDQHGNPIVIQKGAQDRKQNKIVIDIEQAEAVKIMFDMALKGHQRYEIIAKLDECGFRQKNGRNFTGTGVDAILRNEKYMGKYKMFTGKKSPRFNPEIDFVEADTYPAIVSRETFEAVQKLFEKRKYRVSTTAEIEYLLSGKIFCGECGRQYVGIQSQKKSKGKTYIYYKCGDQVPYRNAKHRDDYCRNNAVRKEDTEQYVLWQLKEILFNDTIIDDMFDQYSSFANEHTSNHSMINMLESKVKDIEKQIKNTMAVVTTGYATPTVLETLSSLEEQKKTAINNLINERSAIGHLSATKNEILQAYINAKRILASGIFQERRIMIQNYINKIVVYKDRVEIFINLVPSALLGVVDLEIRKQDFITKLLARFTNPEGDGGDILSPLLDNDIQQNLSIVASGETLDSNTPSTLHSEYNYMSHNLCSTNIMKKTTIYSGFLCYNYSIKNLFPYYSQKLFY